MKYKTQTTSDIFQRLLAHIDTMCGTLSTEDELEVDRHFTERCGQAILKMTDTWHDHADRSFLFIWGFFWLVVPKAISCFLFLSGIWRGWCDAVADTYSQIGERTNTHA